MKKIVALTLELSTKSCFLIGQVTIEKYGLNSVFAIQHIEKVLLKYFLPRDQTNPFVGGGGGGGAVKMLKNTL